ncbi:MAG: DNA replication/repair protein RecF [Thermoanaerobaculia bacterium]
MRLLELTALSFRNLSPEPVFFGAGVTLITGGNAQGKTNLLEAVALLCGQRSFRRARPSEIAADGEAFALSGKIRREDEEETLRLTWSREQGRTFFRGEKNATFPQVARLAPAVFLAPEHRELLTGGPSVRRRFLDRLVLGSRPAAADDLVRYERALAERNALLARPARAAAEELETWTAELARTGSAVRRHRAAALAQWMVHLAPLAREAGPEYQAVSVSYPHDGDGEETLRKELLRVGPAERRRGHSLAGPHRDDLVFSRHGRPLAAHASAGELHRIVSLVKLAEWRAVADASGEAPLLGVDEFEAGLSPAWADAFLASLPEAATVLLTSAGDPGRWRRRIAGVLEIREGRVFDRPRAVNES